MHGEGGQGFQAAKHLIQEQAGKSPPTAAKAKASTAKRGSSGKKMLRGGGQVGVQLNDALKAL